MNEYMLENKIKVDKPIETAAEEQLKNDAGAKARKIATSKVPKKAKHYASVDQSKTINLLGSLSFVMLLVCFIMGATLVQNDDKLNQLESNNLQLLKMNFRIQKLYLHHIPKLLQ